MKTVICLWHYYLQMHTIRCQTLPLCLILVKWLNNLEADIKAGIGLT